MTDSEAYIFRFAEDGSELPRLKMLEAVADPGSLAILERLGGVAGKRVLEMGPGAGSLLRHFLSHETTSTEVWAVDLDLRFLQDLKSPRLHLIEGDIRTVELPQNHFQLIHGRYFLQHIPEAEAVLRRLVDLLEPGGILFLEEPDMSIGRAVSVPHPEWSPAVERVYAACVDVLHRRRVHARMGPQLPRLLNEAGLQGVSWEGNNELDRGGSTLARMMGLSMAQLADQLLSTGLVQQQDLDHYARATADPAAWILYFATYRAWGRKGQPF